MVNIQLASDLHLEFLQSRWPGERLITPAPDADLLVLAGDIAQGADALALFANWPVPVLYVAGNHEFYGHAMATVCRDLNRGAAGTPLQVLDRGRWVHRNVRFLGCTLWTDYRLDPTLDPRACMAQAQHGLNDHYLIRNQQGLFSAEHALREHEASRRWLEIELAQPFDGPTVVVTHHGPHPGSVHPRYVGDPLTPAFVSDLTPLLASADLWLHGHVHDSADYRVGGCRVVTNPRGYARNRGSADSLHHLQFENPAFEAQLTLEVGP